MFGILLLQIAKVEDIEVMICREFTKVKLRLGILKIKRH